MTAQEHAEIWRDLARAYQRAAADTEMLPLARGVNAGLAMLCLDASEQYLKATLATLKEQPDND